MCLRCLSPVPSSSLTWLKKILLSLVYHLFPSIVRFRACAWCGPHSRALEVFLFNLEDSNNFFHLADFPLFVFSLVVFSLVTPVFHSGEGILCSPYSSEVLLFSSDDVWIGKVGRHISLGCDEWRQGYYASHLPPPQKKKETQDLGWRYPKIFVVSNKQEGNQNHWLPKNVHTRDALSILHVEKNIRQLGSYPMPWGIEGGCQTRPAGTRTPPPPPGSKCCIYSSQQSQQHDQHHLPSRQHQQQHEEEERP